MTFSGAPLNKPLQPDADRGRASGHLPPSAPPNKSLEHLCVLVVDDMPDELRMLAHFLGDAGAKVMTAIEGLEALRLARLMRPDLVLLDVQMPQPNGFDVCLALQAQPELADIPVLFISGLLDMPAKLKGFSVGARDFMTKPFTAAELVARVALHAHLGLRLRASQPESGLPRWLTMAVRCLQTSLVNPPSLELLAEEVGTTVYGLHDGFRIHLDTTPTAFVREARMKEAARLLRDTTTPVAEVGAALGYANAANFATTFRERFGVSPRQYRQGASLQPLTIP